MCIYCIMVNDDVIYVGKTIRPFEVRYSEHLVNMRKEKEGTYNGTQLDLYAYMNWAKDRGMNVHAQVLIDAEDCFADSPIDDIQLQTMELGFITYFKQTGRLKNIEGVSKPYKWR